MHFQIQNTPERVRRAGRKEINKQDEEVEEDCPRLILAPFMKPPQVVFDNVVIGTTCEKKLTLLNPTNNMQQITLGKALPPGLIIHLPGECLDVEPETCYCLTMSWTPMQPTALRETLCFTNSDRGRHDVIVVLKSAVSVKTKNNRPKSKFSSGKIQKKTAMKSPVEGKKKDVIIKELKSINVAQTTQYKVVNTRRIQEDISINESVNSNYKKCPFDSINSADLSNTTNFFSNVQRKDEFRQTFDIPKNNYKISEQRNVLKPSNRQNCDTSDTSNIFDNLTFTQLKTLPLRKRLDTEPNIILSVNSDSDFNDIKSENKENETHPVIIASSQPPNKCLSVHMQENNVHYVETPTMTKKIPNTPTEFNSQNRQSLFKEYPQREGLDRRNFAPQSVKPKTMKGKESLTGVVNRSFESNKSYNHNSISHVDNVSSTSLVYSQSLTVNPFLSLIYFCDEQAVEKFETEFKRWLNHILTPPADLDSNIEQKIDVGKAWLESRNKEVPAAPTKEKVCSVYYNSQRLESLRRSARALLFSPEISQVLIKIYVQINKKLIAIRNDRNLHLDLGLQKIIMEILLSYNPLWLRIALEAIYGLVLPLKSNTDLEGLTTFIIQRMFKSPFNKKHSKSLARNILSPTYKEAIKKFTLKKFFTLVFFLDQAKRKKLISHDPCLFCRNAVCKESREVIIRFTSELIAGIGDIIKHLRPLGYVVFHEQSYLEEYKYAVHNIADDIKDGVRLTKVMEIILMKNGLLCQLRTPAISRLQKIHNVQVALNALKEANFVIVGDITAADIADGHREKTLSLLWQIIQVFRAPLFEKAANVIQMWWRKKYEVIVERRKEEERILSERNNAASIIAFWWRQIQYNRLVKQQMLKVTIATIVIQKYCRMWICRHRYRKVKSCAVKIAQWYKDMKEIQKSKAILESLKLEKEMLVQRSAIIIQTYVRRWLTRKRYEAVKRNTILIQSVVRAYLVRKRYVRLVKTVLCIQRLFRRKVLMRRERKSLEEKKQSAILIQSYFRMFKERKHFKALKKSVQIVEHRYKAIILMRIERFKYLKLKQAAIQIQSIYRGKIARREYVQRRSCVIFLQRKIRAIQAMKRDRDSYLRTRNAAITLQRYFKSIILMRTERAKYLRLRRSAIKLQAHVRGLIQRKRYIRLKSAVLFVQAMYRFKRHKILLNKQKEEAAVCIQKYVRRYLVQSWYKRYIEKLKFIQKLWRSKMLTRLIRCDFLQKRNLILKLQAAIRGYLTRKKIEMIKENLLREREERRRRVAASIIQALYRGYIVRKASDEHVKEICRRLRNRVTESRQQTLYERNIEAIKIIRGNDYDYANWIRAFRTLEITAEVLPSVYDIKASSIVRRVYFYISTTNRSISSIELLKSAASLFVNLTRYRGTGPKIYHRDRIPPILKYMLRFSSSETQLFCMFATYLWLFSKYDEVKKDLTECLKMSENHKMMMTIKTNVERAKRMHSNIRSKLNMNQPLRVKKNLLPALEPDYGLTRVEKPRYFEDPQHAITCLFKTYDL